MVLENHGVEVDSAALEGIALASAAGRLVLRFNLSVITHMEPPQRRRNGAR